MPGDGTWSQKGTAVFIETDNWNYIGQIKGEKIKGNRTARPGSEAAKAVGTASSEWEAKIGDAIVGAVPSFVGRWSLSWSGDNLTGTTLLDVANDGTYKRVEIKSRNGQVISKDSFSGRWAVSGGNLNMKDLTARAQDGASRSEKQWSPPLSDFGTKMQRAD